MTWVTLKHVQTKFCNFNILVMNYLLKHGLLKQLNDLLQKSTLPCE